MKKCISILLAVMLIFSLSIPAYAADKKPSAAFVTFGLGGDFFQALADTFVTTMEAEGWNAEYADGQFNPTAQIDAMENYIAKGVDVIVLWSVAPEAMGFVIEQAQAAGIKVIPVVSSVALARLLERVGASAIVAEGGESGGHVGDVSTMALVPQVVDAVKIPVIAAGGIADGRQMAAAFMLGACGVQVGTRFLVANECTVSDEYKKRVLKANDLSTIVTGRSINGAVRCLKTPFSQKFLRAEKEGATAEELGKMGAGSLRKAAKDGNYEEGSFMCGEVAGMVKKEQSAAEIVDDLMQGCEEALKGATKWLA